MWSLQSTNAQGPQLLVKTFCKIGGAHAPIRIEEVPLI